MPAEEPISYVQETMTPELKRLRIMIHNFCCLDDGTLYPSVDLRQYGIESGQVITNSTVQQLCSVHNKIENLNMTNCNQVSDVGLWAIARHLVHLRTLNCSGCTQITTVGLRSISLRCSEIYEMDFTNCAYLDDVSLTVIAGGAWRLKKLNLENCHRISDNAIAKLAKGQGEYLECLNLSGCTSFGEFGDRGLKELATFCHALKELYITAAKRVEDLGLISLATGCPHLTHLTISGCENISKKALKHCVMTWTNMIHFTMIKNSRLQDADFAVFMDSPMAKTLKSVTLQKITNLGDKGIAMICKAVGSYKIHSLAFLECHQLTDYAAMIIGNFCPALRCLDVTNCGQFTDEMIHILARKLKYLVSLKLDGNKRITTKTLLYHISSSPDFEFVEMSNKWLGYEPKPSVENLIAMRKKVRLFHEKATKIQSIVRRKFADRIYWMKYRERLIARAIPLFQAVIRGVAQRKKYAIIRYQIHRIRSAIKIQCAFRRYQATQIRKSIIQRMRYEAYCHKLAQLIQRLYRGHQARRRVLKLRAEHANAHLLDSQKQALLEVKAIIIQRIFRASVARVYTKHLDLQRYQRIQHQKLLQKCARLMQRIVLGYLGRCKANHRREEIRWFEHRWRCAREIQRVYRGLRGRKRFVYFWKLREHNRRMVAAVKVQRIYRGYRGRLLFAIAKALRILRMRQQDCAVFLQRVLRGCMGRHHFTIHKELVTRRKRESTAAMVIQRVYRGHKGREAAMIEKELQSLENKAKPLMKHLQQLEVDRNEKNAVVKKLDSMERLMHANLFEIEQELKQCLLTTNKFTDCARINNTPQRFLTKFLRVRLKDHLEHEVEVHRVKYLEVQAKRAELRDIEVDIVATQRELIPLTTGLIADVKRRRTKGLREKVRKKRVAILRIQAVWRGALARWHLMIQLYGGNAYQP